VSPNIDGKFLDSLEPGGTTEWIEIDGEPAIIDRRSYDTDGASSTDEPVRDSSVRWIADGFVLSVSGPSSREADLIAMARSVRPASEVAFHEVAAQATQRTLTFPAVDEAVFPDGLQVSFRTADSSTTGGSSHSALCAGTMRRHCAQGGGGRGESISTGDDGSITAVHEHRHVHALFSVNGRRELIFWVQGSDLQPQIASITPTSMDPLPFEAVHTDRGVFIRIPAESSIAEVRVTTASGAGGTSISYEVFDPDVG
jgi:hypothetical protein